MQHSIIWLSLYFLVGLSLGVWPSQMCFCYTSGTKALPYWPPLLFPSHTVPNLLLWYPVIYTERHAWEWYLVKRIDSIIAPWILWKIVNLNSISLIQFFAGTIRLLTDWNKGSIVWHLNFHFGTFYFMYLIFNVFYTSPFTSLAFCSIFITYFMLWRIPVFWNVSLILY